MAHPRLVQDWLLETEFPGAAQVWFIMTCRQRDQATPAGITGSLSDQGPDGHGDSPDHHAGEPSPCLTPAGGGSPDASCQGPAGYRPFPIAAVGRAVPFPAPRSSLHDRFMSGPVNHLLCLLRQVSAFYRFGGSAPAAAGAPAAVPPTAFTLRDGRPVGRQRLHPTAWPVSATCPTSAIEYGKRASASPGINFEAL